MASRSRRSPSGSRSAAASYPTSPRAGSTKTWRGPTASHPTPKRAGGQHKNIPDYDPTDKRVLELEAEIVHLTEERNRERQKVKAGAKIAGLFKAVMAEMEQRIKPFAALPSSLRVPPQGPDRRALRHAPFGRPPRSGRAAGGSRRPGRLQLSRSRAAVPSGTSTRSWNGPRTPWPRSSTSRCCGCLAYGDFTSGEIHKACERSYYRNQFKNCLAIGQLHALMYRDLAAHFEEVNVLYLAGNHGRRTPKKDYLGAHDNWDYLCRRGGPAALPRSGQRPLHDSRCVDARTSTSTASASTSATATTCARTWASPGTEWSAGKRA